MRSLIIELDALPSLREATSAAEIDLPAAATLAELAGVDGVRLGANPDRKPVREEDLRDTRRAARRLELRMTPNESLLGLALELRPDRVLIARDSHEGVAASAPLDLRAATPGLAPVVRSLTEAGIPVHALVQPNLDAVKRMHGEGAAGVEFYTGVLIDLPASDRESACVTLGDASRLAAKLDLTVGLAGGLGYRNVGEVLEAAPSCDRVAVGRSALARAVLVGLDQALRDLRARIE